MQAITPYSVLCPSTPFFLLSLVAYVFGLYKYSALDTQEFERGFVYAYSIISGLIHLDRHNILVSFQITMPLAIWTATIMIPVGIWMFRTIFPGTHRKYLEGKRKRDEEWKKLLELPDHVEKTFLIFTSPSTVRSFFKIIYHQFSQLSFRKNEREVLQALNVNKVVSIGPKTSLELKKNKIDFIESSEYTINGALESLLRLIKYGHILDK